MSLDQKTIQLLVKCDCCFLYKAFIDTQTSKADLLRLPIPQIKQKLRTILPLGGVGKREEIIAKIVHELTKDDEEDGNSSYAAFRMELDQLLVAVEEGILNKCDETLKNQLKPENFAKLVQKFITLIPPEDREEQMGKLDKVVFESALAVEDPSFYKEYAKIVHSARGQQELASAPPEPGPSQRLPPQRQIYQAADTSLVSVSPIPIEAYLTPRKTSLPGGQVDERSFDEDDADSTHEDQPTKGKIEYDREFLLKVGQQIKQTKPSVPVLPAVAKDANSMRSQNKKQMPKTPGESNRGGDQLGGLSRKEPGLGPKPRLRMMGINYPVVMCE